LAKSRSQREGKATGQERSRVVVVFKESLFAFGGGGENPDDARRDALQRDEQLTYHILAEPPSELDLLMDITDYPLPRRRPE
jgi:hypothetical protein